jgi:hypothetical protein
VTANGSARYFFLSYPRLPPLPRVPGVDVADLPDEWVRAFYDDLTEAVSARAGASPLLPGFLDLGASSAAAQRAELIDGLSTAEVFVPLLSPEYARRSWPRQEWASFEHRAERAQVADPLRRAAPVLWVPMAPGEHPAALAAALSMARGAERQPYAENGLRALLRLPRYRDAYLEILGRVAARVVSLAEESPIGPSPADDPACADSGLGREAKTPPFVVVVAAAAEAGAGHGDGDGLGARFAEYAQLVAEQQGFAVVRPQFEKSDELLQRAPGVVLIDPALVAGNPGRDQLNALIGELPSWVLPVIVSGEDGGQDNAAEVRRLLESTYNGGKSHPDTVRRGFRGVGSLREFILLMPSVVGHAEREYLRHGPIQRSVSGPAFRPRLAGGRGVTPLSVEEKPDV